MQDRCHVRKRAHRSQPPGRPTPRTCARPKPTEATCSVPSVSPQLPRPSSKGPSPRPPSPPPPGQCQRLQTGLPKPGAPSLPSALQHGPVEAPASPARTGVPSGGLVPAAGPLLLHVSSPAAHTVLEHKPDPCTAPPSQVPGLCSHEPISRPTCPCALPSWGPSRLSSQGLRSRPSLETRGRRKRQSTEGRGGGFSGPGNYSV